MQDDRKQKIKIESLKENWEDMPRETALMGLDIGKKTIGIAVSNPDQTISTPLETIKRTKFTKDAEILAKLAKEFDVSGFIIGYPINMDGSEGPKAQSIRDFAVEFASYLNEFHIPPQISLWDERLSTATVEDIVDKHVDKRKTKINKKESGLVDKLAAQIILGSALDFLKHSRKV